MEIFNPAGLRCWRRGSPSSRRAWIEIASCASWGPERSVALLAEGVDRNDSGDATEYEILVALLAEGVDRNPFRDGRCIRTFGSPSSRRAWIEIPLVSSSGWLSSG